MRGLIRKVEDVLRGRRGERMGTVAGQTGGSCLLKVTATTGQTGAEEEEGKGRKKTFESSVSFPPSFSRHKPFVIFRKLSRLQ